MIDTPEVVQVGAQLTALIHITIPRSEIRSVMGPGIGELLRTIASQGISPTGPVFCHHLRIVPDIFDFEISVPVAQPVSHESRVKPGQLPAATVARTIYHGPYEGLHAAWLEFDQWIGANGHFPCEDVVERYLTGPESGPDATAWRTELSRPLLR